MTALLLSVALKGAAVLAVAFLVLAALRDAPAALRHGVWTAAFAALLVISVLGVYGPSWRLPVLPAETAHPEVILRSATTDAPVVSLPDASRLAPLPDLPHAHADGAAFGPQGTEVFADDATGIVAGHASASPWQRSFGGSLLGWLVGLWALGGALVLTRWLGAYASAARLVARAQPVTDEAWLDAAELARRLVDVRKPVRLLVTDALTVPVAWGFGRYAVVLPSESDGWSDERREAVLLHEMAHLRRDDARTQLVAQLAVALHWPNPLAWLAYRRFLVEREHACDDAVLSGGAAASDYAGHLVEIARRAGRRDGLAMSAMSPMARRSDLEGRVLSILDAGRRRVAAGSGSLGRTVALGLLVAAPLAVFRPVAAEAPPAPAAEVGLLDVGGPVAGDLDALAESDLDDAVRGEVDAAVALAVEAATDRLPRALADTIPRAEAVLGPARAAALADVRRMRADGLGLSADAWDEIEDGVRDAFDAARHDYEAAVEHALAEAHDDDWRRDLRASLDEAATERAQALAEAEQDRIEALAEMAEAVADRTAGWGERSADARRDADRATRARQRSFAAAERERQRSQSEADAARERALQDADRQRRDALREAEQARQEAFRDGQRARDEALREADRIRREALREAERVRRSARDNASARSTAVAGTATSYAYSTGANGTAVATAVAPGVGAWMAQLDDIDRGIDAIERAAADLQRTGKASTGALAGLKGGLVGLEGGAEGIASAAASWARSDTERGIARRRLDATRARLRAARREVAACEG